MADDLILRDCNYLYYVEKLPEKGCKACGDGPCRFREVATVDVVAGLERIRNGYVGGLAKGAAAAAMLRLESQAAWIEAQDAEIKRLNGLLRLAKSNRDAMLKAMRNARPMADDAIAGDKT
jgi:hypothetical protein